MGTPLTDLVEPLNILYYGDAGTGKTTHTAEMANLGRILVFNAESGLKAKALARRGVEVKNIEVYTGDYTYDAMLAEWKRIVSVLKKSPDHYVGVVWDSVTEIHKALLEDVVAKAKAKDEARGKEHDNTQLQDYGVMTEQVRSLVRKFRDLPCHFSATALAKREVDQEDGKTAYLPDVTRGLVNNLYGWFDVVAFTFVDESGQYWGRFNPAGKYRAKDRMNILPALLADPTFTRVLDYVDEELTVEEDEIHQAAVAARSAADIKTTKKEVAA